MRRILLITTMLIAASTITLGRSPASFQNGPTSNDEEALKQLIKESADAVVHADLARLDKFLDDECRGSVEGISFNKKMLLAALKSDQPTSRLKVARWGDWDDLKVNVSGNSAVVTGRYTLSTATYMGKDFSGRYNFTDRFVKQSDGSWRAVHSESKRIKQ